MSVWVSEKRIKSKIKSGDRVAVIENIKYPYFESEGKKQEKLCKKMNDFYTSIAEKYSHHARVHLVKRIKKSRLACRLPMTLTMNYTIALCNDKIISVVLDLAFTQGKTVRTRRFSQLWSIKKQDILSPSEIIKTDRASRKRIFSYVLSMAKKNGESGTFGYFGDYLAKLPRHFDIRSFFVVPKGLCFFINAGILSPVKYGTNNFVIGADGIDGLLLGDFLPKEEENRQQNGNIVNNI